MIHPAKRPPYATPHRQKLFRAGTRLAAGYTAALPVRYPKAHRSPPPPLPDGAPRAGRNEKDNALDSASRNRKPGCSDRLPSLSRYPNRNRPSPVSANDRGNVPPPRKAHSIPRTRSAHRAIDRPPLARPPHETAVLHRPCPPWSTPHGIGYINQTGSAKPL